MCTHNWVPSKTVLIAARRDYTGPNTRQKHEYRCAACGEWHARKHVAIDHVTPCGSLRRAEDLPGFLARLHCESPSGYQVLCDACHAAKTAAERSGRTASRETHEGKGGV